MPVCKMSKANPLGLIAAYGDSDEESDDGSAVKCENRAYFTAYENKPSTVQAGIHPSPIAHCPWSACYDENSGFTYYWNQQTNAVTWEAPTEYLLALKLAQQQLTTAGSTEVSAEEWQLYQQALAEKQTQKTTPSTKPAAKKTEKSVKSNKKRSKSDDEEKIELITSYHNSDSESNDETEKSPTLPTPKPSKIAKVVQKKPRALDHKPPSSANQNYMVPIGPELPPGLENKSTKHVLNEEVKLAQKSENDCPEEKVLLRKLKDKAKLLEKLGGELPSDVQEIIKDDMKAVDSPKSDKDVTDIDVLLEEIEKKELPKVKPKTNEGGCKSGSNSPRDKTTPSDDAEPKNTPNGPSLFPSAAFIDKNSIDKDTPPIDNQKKENLYLMNTETVDNVNRKRLRISNSVLPDRKRDKVEIPTYTTKYAQFVEGVSSERTGLGFSKDEECTENPKNTISYGNGLTFTKGETLNEEKKDEDLDDLTDLVEAKLKFLSQIQPYTLTTIQEMMIQMQTLLSAFRAGALSSSYWRRWAGGARSTLAAHEAAAAPPGWKCVFLRSEGRYCYTREVDGFQQYEYPAVDTTDMDISTTPPHEPKEESWRATPPPPGTDDAEQTINDATSKKEIGDELQSFYNDIAEIEKSSGTEPNSPEPPQPPPPPEISDTVREMREMRETRETREMSREKDVRLNRKKSKVKLSTCIGMKHKSVSNLVAKWQQVAEEINSD
ncbi:formin-binding protein 4-like [Danaus plexippus]|uniref:formin-binding protein 4-like n=1 Tax=Danaus plexippus TaxID=13037 RepID=UPI002AAF8EBF|nr:formin-binding protein 4-like [Danaus plexippus]